MCAQRRGKRRQRPLGATAGVETVDDAEDPHTPEGSWCHRGARRTGQSGRGIAYDPLPNDCHVDAGACAPAPGLDQSHTPSGKIAASRCACSSVKLTPYDDASTGWSRHLMTNWSRSCPATMRELLYTGNESAHGPGSS